MRRNRRLTVVIAALIAVIAITPIALADDAISPPVSVKFPLSIDGVIPSSPVSVKFPLSIDGVIPSSPVSVKFPLSIDGIIPSPPVSVKFPSTVDGIIPSQSVSVVVGPPVATWHMDGDWLDSSGNGLDATPNGEISFEAEGRINSAGDFDGVDDFLDIGTSSLLRPPIRFSIEAWIRVASGSTGEMLVAGNLDQDASTGYGLTVDGSTVSVKFGDGTMHSLGSSVPITQGVWVYVVGTYNGQKLNLYIDGELDSEVEINNLLTYSAPFTIGDGNGTNYFAGEIDEVSVYIRALTEEEIRNHYAVGAGIDIIPPEPPSVDPVDHIVATAGIYLSGTKEAESLVLVNGQPITLLTNATDWSGNYTLYPGINTLRITSKDASGNESSPPVVVEVIYDNTAPHIVINIPFDGAFINGFDSIDILLADEYSAIDFTSTIQSASVMASDGSEVAGSWQEVDGHVVFTKEDLLDDTYTVNLVSTDVFGNSGSVSFEFTLDTKAPEVESLSISPDSVFRAGETGTFTIVFNEEVLTSEPLTVSFGAEPPYDTYQLPGSWTDHLTWTGSYWFTNSTSDGTYKLAVSGAVDKAQNEMALTEAGSFVLDTAAPDKPILDQVAGLINTPIINISGTKSPYTAIHINGIEVVALSESVDWSAELNLSEGENQISVTVVDEAGNESDPALATIVVDTIAPELLSSVPEGNSSVNQIETIDILLSDDTAGVDYATTIANAEILLGEQTINGDWSESEDGHLIFTPEADLADGSYSVILDATDEAGNSATVSISFSMDTASPVIEAFTMNPTSPHKAEEASFIVTFGEDMDTTVQPMLTFTRGDNYPVFSIESGNWESDSRTWSGSFDFDATNGDGEYSVSISGANDSAGNEMVPASIGSFVLDTVPPVEPVIYDVESPTRNSQIILSGQKDSESFCYVNNIQTDAAYSETQWDYGLTLHEGDNAISVYCRDEAGNQSQTQTASITLDTQAPSLVSTVPAGGTSVTELASVAIMLSDASAIDPITISGAEIRMNDNTVDGEWSIDGGNVTFSLAGGLPFEEGNYVVTLYPEDVLGNRRLLTFSFNVDRGPPSVESFVMSPASPHKAENVKFTITFNEGMSGVQQVYFSKGSENYTISGSLINPRTWQGWYDFRSSEAADGIYDVSASGAADIAGNEMPAANIGTFELDTTAPGSPTIGDVVPRTNVPSQLIEGTKPENTAIVINGYLRVSINESTSWAYPYTLTEGTNNLSVVARDAAGNDSTAPATAQIVLDTTPPVFTVEYESITSSPSQTVSGTKEPGSIGKLKVGNEISDMFGSDDTSGTWEYIIENLIEGLPNKFTFIASDDLGNTRTISIVIYYDVSAPLPVAEGMLVVDGSGSGTEVTLSWDAYTEVQDVGYYRIYMSSSDFGDITGMTPIGTVDKGMKTYKVSELTEGSTYYFAVVPVDMGGNYESEVYAASGVPEDTVAPENVKINSVIAGHNATDGNRITVFWQSSANLAGDLADQVVYFDDGSGYDTGTSIGETATQYTKTGLSDDKVYKFKITTKDDKGHESSGTVATGVTRLTNPSGLSAEPGNGKVALSWQPTASVNSQYLKQYNIYRRASAATQTNADDMTFVTSTTSTSYTNTGLENEVTYQYAVTSVNIFGAENTEVQSVSAKTRADAIGPEITALSINEGAVITAPVTITASASDSESAMQKIELYVDGVLVETDPGGSLSYSWNVIEIEDGNHSIKVIAYDVHGNATELVRQVIVSLAPPATPQITNHAVVGYTASIVGTAPVDTTVTLKVNGLVVSSTSEVGGHFSFSSVELVEGDNILAVKASHRGGDSPYSAGYSIVVDTGAPPSPVNLSAEARAGGSVLFTWEKGVGETPTGYNIYMGTGEFTSTTGIAKVNTSPITYAFKELTPPDDDLRYYAVTALDSNENESEISNLVSAASDRAAPSVTAIEYTYTSSEGAVTSPAEVAGLGTVDISMTVSEPLKELPFLSLEPESGSPIIISLNQISDTVYEGSFAVTAQSPTSPLTYKFSGKDLVGNRGTVSGESISLDVSGPVAAIQEPLQVQQVVSGIVPVSVLFDEPPVGTPQMELRASDDTAVPVDGLTVTEGTGGLGWVGFVDVSSMPEGTAEFVLVSAEDSLGNTGTTVAEGRYIILYKDTVPPPAVPTGLEATTAKGGIIRLTWNPVSDVTSYSLWRRAEGETQAVKVLSGITTPEAEDLPPEDGTYYYSVSSVGLLESESARSEEASAVSDRTGPPAPENLTVELTGSGVVAEWSPVDDESVFGYHLYRLPSAEDTIAGRTPIAKVGGTLAIDPAPTKQARFYVVVAVDDLKNEGPTSLPSEIVFNVPPVPSLVLEKIDSGAPTITWTAPSGDVTGYHIYRNGVKITGDVPVDVKTYTDGYYAGGTSTYAVSVVDSLGNESPLRQVTLSPVGAEVEEGTVLRRGLLEALKLNITSGYAEALNIDSISLKVGTATPSTITGPFTVEPGQAIQVEKVAATTAGATGTVPVIATLQWSPEPGTTVRITRTSQAEVIGASTALEIFNEPLVRDTQGSVRLKFNNLGSALMEVVTSENNGKTTKVKVNLRDQDGNLLSTGYLNQRTGDSIVNLGGYAVARLEPGASFISDPISINVPANAPNRVVIEAVIQNTYYHYGKADQVTAPGMRQTVETSIVETAYYAVAAPEKTFYPEPQPVVITGQALDSLSGEPVADVPVRLGVSVKGFDRLYTVTTGADGSFTHTFEPGANEAGLYSIWAVHPDVFDRTVQATFAIASFKVSPSFAGITMAKGRTQDVPVTLYNYGGAALTGLSFTTDSSEGITAEVINPGDDVVKPGENQRVTFRVGATESAPETGYAVMNATVAEGLSVKVNSSIKTVSYIPIIKTSPSYIVAGMVRGDRKLVSFTVRNSGQETLKNASLEGLSTPWMNLMVENVIGDLAPGESRSIGIMLAPPADLAAGTYDDSITIYSDNHIPYTYHIQVKVQSDAVGSVLFDVLNELLEDVPGASIVFQHQEFLDLRYNATTGADGTVMVNDIPEGRYVYNISATGHVPYSGTFVVQPGLTTTVPVALEVTLIDIEWSVSEVVIQDRYEITIKQTFQTQVPAPVIVIEPPVTNLPVMKAGDVFNGEFTVTNYGFIEVYGATMSFPTSVGDYDIEVMTDAVPDKLGAMQTITVPFRVTRRATSTAQATSLFEEVMGYGGGTCGGSFSFVYKASATLCPNTPQESVRQKSASHLITYPPDEDASCGGGGGGFGGGTGGGGAWYGGGGGSQGGGAIIRGSSPAPLKTGNPCECKDDGTVLPDDNPFDCKINVCSGGSPAEATFAECSEECSDGVCLLDQEGTEKENLCQTNEPVASAVRAANGTYTDNATDLTVPAHGLPVEWLRSYHSNTVRAILSAPPSAPALRKLPIDYRCGKDGEARCNQIYFRSAMSPLDKMQPGPSSAVLPSGDGPMGYGWTSPYFAKLRISDTFKGLVYFDGDGWETYFHEEPEGSGSYEADAAIGVTVLKTESGYELKEAGGPTRTFDADGKLTAIRDLNGNEITLQYNAEGRLQTITDTTGRVALTFTHNGAGKIASVTDAAGRAVTYEYDTGGRLIEVYRDGQLEATYGYDANNNLASKANALGEEYTIEYGQYPGMSRSVAKRIVDPAGNEMTFGYDYTSDSGFWMKLYRNDTSNDTVNFFTIKDYNGRTRKLTTDERGRLLREEELENGSSKVLRLKEYPSDNVEKTTDAAGNITTIQRDELRNIISVVDGEGNETGLTYNANRQPLTMTDASGVVTRFDYDAKGNLVKLTQAKGMAEQAVTTYAYNSYGEVTGITRGGATSTIAYNDVGLPESVTDPLGNTTSFEYDEDGNLNAVIDASGNRTELVYDSRGNMLSSKDPLGHITEFTYDLADRLTSLKDPLGRVTSVETDFKGRVTALVDALGNRREFAYDAGGNLVSITEGAQTTTMSYDSANRLISVTDAAGNVTQYEYAAAGCSSCGGSVGSPAKVTDPLGNVTRFAFDGTGRIASMTDPLSNVASLVRDANGRVKSRTDTNGNTVTYEYDALGRVIKVIDANGGETSFTYDSRGNLLSLTDPGGNTTTYAYDLADRVIKETQPMGQTTEYTYYANGLLKTVKDARGQVTTYTYDAAGRLTEKTYADGKTDTFAYDAAGNLVTYANDAVNATIKYDELGRQLSETVDFGGFTKTYSYTYDQYGNKASYTSAEGVEHSYAYNGINQLTSIGFEGKSISFDYQAYRLIRATLPNGISTDYQYNANSWLTSIIAKQGTTTLMDYAYTHDKAGNILTKSTGQGDYSYAYDSTYQLTGAQGPELPVEAYTYDASGNRISGPSGGVWTYNANGELLGRDTITYAYDANGNVTHEVRGTLLTIYHYDSADRLASVELPGGTVSEYAYDPFGRRVSKTVDGRPGDSPEASEATFYLYAEEGLTGEYNAMGALQKAYGWAPDSIFGTNPLYMLEGGEYYFYHNDHLGTPQKLTDISGSVVWSATYTAFGEATVDAASTIENNLRFPGQYFDAETGLHYNWNRYYSPETGRYTQVDPIGFSAEDANLYRYVFNNPINLIDPEGLLSLNIPLLPPMLQPLVSFLEGAGIKTSIDLWIPLGEQAGLRAAEYWADKSINPKNAWYESAYYNFMGGLASLWMPCTSDKTFFVLSTAAGLGKWSGRPFWRYVGPKSNPNSPFLTRGLGWKPPYGRNFELAQDRLQMPHMPNNVVKIHVPWYKYIKGPYKVKGAPKLGSGGGPEYYRN